MNQNVTYALKSVLALGLAVVLAQQIMAQAVKKTRAREPAPPISPQPAVPGQPFCETNPEDPLCTSFGGPGEAWI